MGNATDTVAEIVAAAEECLAAHEEYKPWPADFDDFATKSGRVRYRVAKKAWADRRRNSRERLREALLDHDAAERAGR